MVESSKVLMDELIQNNLALEKATLQLVDSVKTLSDRMDRLLGLFETAAQAIDVQDIKEPLGNQLQQLLEQNKSIARGLLILEKYIREQGGSSFSTRERAPSFPKMM